MEGKKDKKEGGMNKKVWKRKGNERTYAQITRGGSKGTSKEEERKGH